MNLINYLRNKNILPYLVINICIGLIWFRYIREKLPKDLPISLTGFSLAMLFATCFIYFYLLILLITKTQINKGNLLRYLKKKLSTSLSNGKNTYIYTALKKGVSLLLKYKKNLSFTFIYIYGDVLPRILFQMSFIVDVFYFKQLFIIYYTGLLLLLPLTITIIKHIIEYFMKDNVAEIDRRSELYSYIPIKIDKDFKLQLTIVPAQELVNTLTACSALNLPPVQYDPILKIDYMKETRKKLNISPTLTLDASIFSQNIIKAINYSVSLNFILYNYKQIQGKYQKRLSFISNLTYFFLWTYILIISFHTFDLNSLEELLSWLPISDKDNPFI